MSCNPTTGNDFGSFIAQQSQCGAIDENPVFSKVRRTGGKPEDVTNYTTSSEVKSNRQARKQIRESKTFETSIDFELSDMAVRFLENAFYNTYTTYINYNAQIDLVASTNKILDAANGFTDVQSGQWVFIQGSSFDFMNSGYYVVNKVSDGELDIAPGQILVDVIGETLTMTGTMLRTGSTNKYLTSQKRVKNTNAAEDQTDYVTFIDGLVSSLAINVPPTGMMTGSLNITSRDRTPGEAKIFGQTDGVDNSGDIATSCDGLDQNIYIDFAKQDTAFTEFSMELNNNLQTVDKAGRCGPGTIDATTLECTGSLNAISFEDNPLVEIKKYEDGDRFTITVPIKFPDDKKMFITLRSVIYTENTQGDGADEVVQSTGTFAAEEDEFGTSVQIDLDFDPSLI